MGPFDWITQVDPSQLAGIQTASDAAGPALLAAQNAPEPQPKTIFAGGLMRRLLPTSPDMAGLISPEDAAAARRSMFMRLGAAMLANAGPRPKGTSNVFQRLGQAVQQSGITDWSGTMQQLAQLHAGLQDYQAKQDLQKKRQAIFAQYPAADNETPSDTAARLLKVFNGLGSIGDEEGMARMAELLPSLLSQRQPPIPTTFQGVGPDGKPQVVEMLPGGATRPTGYSPYSKPAGQGNPSTVDRFLQSGFDQHTKDLKSRYETVNAAVASAREALAGNGSAQYGLLDNFVRTFNPRASVRKGMIDLYRENLPVSQRAVGEMDRYLQGRGGLSQQTVYEMMRALQPVEAKAWADYQREYSNSSALTRQPKYAGASPPQYLFSMPDRPDFTGLLGPQQSTSSTGGGSATSQMQGLVRH